MTSNLCCENMTPCMVDLQQSRRSQAKHIQFPPPLSKSSLAPKAPLGWIQVPPCLCLPRSFCDNSLLSDTKDNDITPTVKNPLTNPAQIEEDNSTQTYREAGRLSLIVWSFQCYNPSSPRGNNSDVKRIPNTHSQMCRG